MNKAKLAGVALAGLGLLAVTVPQTRRAALAVIVAIGGIIDDTRRELEHDRHRASR
jgi:hypothetical protein